MKITLKLARVGMNMQEATVAEWFKQPGDTFTSGEALYSIETDKVTQEVPATADGRWSRYSFPPATRSRWVPRSVSSTSSCEVRQCF